MGGLSIVAAAGRESGLTLLEVTHRETLPDLGARIEAGGEVILLRNTDKGPLDPVDFTEEDFISYVLSTWRRASTKASAVRAMRGRPASSSCWMR